MAADDVVINGVTIDINDACAVAAELRKVELVIATGGGVAMTRFGDDEVRWTPANSARLTELIDRYDRACAVKSGTRRRYAKRMRFI